MVKFCEICNNILEVVFTNDVLAFKCNSCTLPYQATPQDTLRKTRIKESDVMLFDKILNKAAEDPATIKAKLDCINKKCNFNKLGQGIVKQVRIGPDMRLYNICLNCQEIWLNQ